MSVGKNSISRISTTATKKPAPKAEKVEVVAEVAPVETAPVEPVKAPAKKPATKKPAAKKAPKTDAFKIYQVSDELPYYLL